MKIILTKVKKPAQSRNVSTSMARVHRFESRRGRVDTGRGIYDVKLTTEKEGDREKERGGEASQPYVWVGWPGAGTFLPSPQLRPKELPSRLRFHSARAYADAYKRLYLSRAATLSHRVRSNRWKLITQGDTKRSTSIVATVMSYITAIRITRNTWLSVNFTNDSSRWLMKVRWYGSIANCDMDRSKWSSG